MIMTVLGIIGLIIFVLIALVIGYIALAAFFLDAGFKARDEEAMKIIEEQKKSQQHISRSGFLEQKLEEAK